MSQVVATGDLATAPTLVSPAPTGVLAPTTAKLGARPGRLLPLDGLRAIAVTLVLLNHTDGRIATGHAGVSIFFVLSGYLITGVLTGEVRESGRIHLGYFYLRRLLRLYPALLAMLAVVVALGAAPKTAAVAATYTTNLVQSLLGNSMHAFSHTWSLAQEEQFYLVWPLVLPFVLRAKRVAMVLLTLVAAGSALAAWLASARAEAGHTESWLVIMHSFNPLYQVHGVIIGCLLALALSQRVLRHRSVLVVVSGLLLLTSMVILHFEQHREWLLGWNVVLLPELAAAAFIAGVTGGAGRGINAAFGNRVIVWVGQRSYAIYLWHYPFIVLGIDHGWSQHRAAAVGIPVAFVLAELSYRYIEAPFLRLKSRLHAAPPSAPAPAPRPRHRITPVPSHRGTSR